MNQLIECLNKKLMEVETFDLRLYLSLYKENRKVTNRTLDNIRKTISSFWGWLNDGDYYEKFGQSIEADQVCKSGA